MPTVSRTFSVSRAAEVVDYLKDFGNAEEWDPGTQRCTRIDSGPLGRASWHNVSNIFGVTAELTYTLDKLTDRTLVFVGRTIIDVHRTSRRCGGAGSVITYRTTSKCTACKLLNPVMKLAFEKLANDTEKQLTTVLNRLPRSRNDRNNPQRARRRTDRRCARAADHAGQAEHRRDHDDRARRPGSFIGTWLTYQFGYSNSNGGFEIIPFLVGIIVAIVLIAIYVGITGRRGTTVR